MIPVKRKKYRSSVLVHGIFWWLIPFQILAADTSAPVPPTPCISVGTALVSEKNVAEARNQAIANALSSAVVTALAQTVASEEMSRRFQWINQRFCDRTNDFIQEYKVLAENQVEGRYRVLLSAVVSKEPLLKILAEKGISGDPSAGPKAAAGTGGKPRVLVCVAERMGHTEPYTYWWSGTEAGSGVAEPAIVKALRDREFTVADHKETLPGQLHSAVKDKPELSPHEAMALGRNFGVDVVVYGTVQAERVQSTMHTGVKTLPALLRSKAIRVDTGQELLSLDETAVTVDSDEISGGRKAILQVGGSGGERLGGDLAAAWDRPAAAKSTSPMISILVSGTRQLSSFIAFRKILSQIPGVSEVEIRRMEKDQADMAVVYSGTSRQMADALAAKSEKNLNMDIRVLTPDSLTVAFIPG